LITKNEVFVLQFLLKNIMHFFFLFLIKFIANKKLF